MTAARMPVSPDGISLLLEKNSLFVIAGNPSLRQRKGMRISALAPSRQSSCGGNPCISPAHQGLQHRDEFPPDCPHRQLVRVTGDGDAGMPMAPKTPCIRGVLGEGPGEGEPETGGCGLGRRRGAGLCLLANSAVRFGSRVASAKDGAQQCSAEPLNSFIFLVG
jgi:hypothetical protein